ncbi:MAG TPA: hypothetical protein VEO19_10845 [Terriglobia bacterium]|nr:hypothetical protein [Terriglobia bacterium]
MRGVHAWITVEGVAGFRLSRLAGVCVTLALASSVFAKNQSQNDTHIVLIRGLLREIAVSKVPLPRGSKGVRVDSQGKLDKADADSQLSANGLAIKPGMPVEISKITFRAKEIVFELNGGGKKKSKWYEHLEVGVGATTTPIAQAPPVLAYGSWITLVFPGKVPKLSVDQVKQALGNVIDFTRRSPTELYAPEVPAKFKEAIKNHQVIAGMDRDAVLSSKGPPDRKVREVRDGVEQEDWIYGSPPHVLFVTFDGDSVVQVHQY